MINTPCARVISWLCLALFVTHAGAAEIAIKGKANEAVRTGHVVAADTKARKLTFRQLTGQNTLALRGTEGSATIAFGGRADELVTRLTLNLRYSYSPALIFGQSHLKVLLNDETVAVVPFTKESAGRSTTQTIEIDPRVVADFNRLKVQFIGHYATDCEDQLHSALWAEVSGSSELQVTTQPTLLPNDLAMLPEPFFDRLDLRRLTLPFVLPADPSREVITAAGVIASWFGQLAVWRGARFPVAIDQPTKGHAIVMGVKDALPGFLGDRVPSIEGPTLAMITNPEDGYSKLLLVLGRDAAELKAVAVALVVGSAALSGASARIGKMINAAPRKAYDAPSWVRLDRPTTFAELSSVPSDLQAQGHTPDWINVQLRVPPDLFTWRGRGVPLNLKYRHNAPPMSMGSSRLTVNVNGTLLRSLDLASTEPAGNLSRVRAALIEDSRHAETADENIPALRLGTRNQLRLGFAFGVPKEGACRDSFVHNVGGVIDPDSSVDFSGYSHYTALPQLGYFVNAGFPFTKYADLSQTVVVLPSKPSAPELETFLTVMGRMGEATGHPATRVRVAAPESVDQLKDVDLLLIGASERLGLLDTWQDKFPVVLAGPSRRFSLPAQRSTLRVDWLGLEDAPDASVATRAEIIGSGPLAALISFESPITPKRTVVALTAGSPEHLRIGLDAFEDSGLVRAMHGSTVFIHPNKVESYLVGPTYFVGQLSPWTWVWYHASRYPALMTVVTLLAALILAVLAWRGLRFVVARRIAAES